MKIFLILIIFTSVSFAQGNGGLNENIQDLLTEIRDSTNVQNAEIVELNANLETLILQSQESNTVDQEILKFLDFLHFIVGFIAGLFLWRLTLLSKNQRSLL